MLRLLFCGVFITTTFLVWLKAEPQQSTTQTSPLKLRTQVRRPVAMVSLGELIALFCIRFGVWESHMFP